MPFPRIAANPSASNLGHSLTRFIAEQLGIRAPSKKPELLRRSGGFLASSVDRQEAYKCGIAAVAAARRESPVSRSNCGGNLAICIDAPHFRSHSAWWPRKNGSYPPNGFARNNYILQAFSAYAGPLIGALSAYPCFLE